MLIGFLGILVFGRNEKIHFLSMGVITAMSVVLAIDLLSKGRLLQTAILLVRRIVSI